MPERVRLVNIEDERLGIDVDTEEDYERVKINSILMYSCDGCNNPFPILSFTVSTHL